ncbi:MAG TPA: DUF4142 domain-containing protein [Kofleriaceae bacterium]|nr:DUF4142 domain-containing protein [Kofleriaceae bacterium]
MKIHACSIIAAAALALPALAAADTPKTSSSNSATSDANGKLSADDTKIVAHLHHVNQMEIDLGKQAQKVGTPAVKGYADALVSDHTSGDKDLTALAKKHGVSSIPADKPQTDADRQDEKDMTIQMTHLKTLKGAEFDKAFLTMMASGHDKELAKIDTAIGTAKDSDLQAQLKATKPVLQRHADQARDLQKGPQAANPASATTQPAK